MIKTSNKRKKLIDSVIKWMSEPSLFFVDGIDINWELFGGQGSSRDVPALDIDGYLEFIKELRLALDNLGLVPGRHFELTNSIKVSY